MACGQGGYVGIVRLEDGQLEIAAALDRPAIRRAGSPAVLAQEILAEARLPLPPHLLSSVWRGTPALTRRPVHVAARGLFVVGDAAGYVEPFTGEGIAWAMTTGIAVAPIAHQASLAWERRLATSWSDLHRHLVARRQKTCRVLAQVLRTPTLANVAAVVLRFAPWMAIPLIRAVNAPRVGKPVLFRKQHDSERLVTT